MILVFHRRLLDSCVLIVPCISYPKRIPLFAPQRLRTWHEPVFEIWLGLSFAQLCFGKKKKKHFLSARKYILDTFQTNTIIDRGSSAGYVLTVIGS